MPNKMQEQYKIKIDKDNHSVQESTISGREILLLAEKQPVEQYMVYLKEKGCGAVVVGLDENVDLSQPGKEKFVTIPVDQTEGEIAYSNFVLPANDEQFLDSECYSWEAVVEGGIRRVIIYNFPVLPGYNVDKVDLNLRIGAGYPDEQVDMVYFYPPLQRADSKPIQNLSTDNFKGKIWQRWSRHRTPQNPWRPGIDDISTHLACVTHWLARELKK